MDLTWFFEGCPSLVPRKLCLYYITLACVMESSGSSGDSPPLDIESHILRTLNDGMMGLVGADSIMMTHIWVGSPTG